jgi:hypothetical protein
MRDHLTPEAAQRIDDVGVFDRARLDEKQHHVDALIDRRSVIVGGPAVSTVDCNGSTTL